jgi:hypothetical protein
VAAATFQLTFPNPIPTEGHIMTDQIITEGERIVALAHLRLVESKLRAGIARTLLGTLGQMEALTPSDRHDQAHAFWIEFLGVDRGRDIPLELQAGVFAQTSFWLDAPTLLRLAREAWGAVEFDVADGLERVQWLPDDDALIITATRACKHGTPFVTCMVITPSGVTGAMR